MKKIFWCSVAVAVAAASSVYLASRHVEEYSFKAVGHAIASLGGDASKGAAAGQDDGTVVPEPIPTGLPAFVPDEPMSPATTPTPIVADGSVQGRIIIDEADPIADFPITTTVTATQVYVQTTPAKMPYCEDDTTTTTASQRRMPYAEDEDGAEEEAEVWGLLRQAAREATEEASKTPEKLPVMPKEVEEQEKAPEEQSSGANMYTPNENSGYHQHDQVCPYSGHSCPREQICPPAPEVPVEKKEPMGSAEEQEPPHQQLDTMEFRPSDAGFQHFVPRPF